jgi:hypothetical protein
VGYLASVQKKERLFGQRPGHHDQVPEKTAAGNRLATTIKYLRGAAGIGLGTTTKYPQCTTTQLPEPFATHNERRRGQRTGHTPVKYSGLLMCPFTTSTLHSPCLVLAVLLRQQTE